MSNDFPAGRGGEADLAPGVLDTRAFRDALGSFVTGVTIITTSDAAGRPAGFTANSFNSVSLDPPMVLFSLARDSISLEAFRQARWWAVHVLTADQQALSSRFARRDANKFAGIATTPGPGGIPLLEDCAARFICRAAFEYEGGDHAIFLGEVREFDQADHKPLIYHRGRYGGVLPAPDAAPMDSAALESLARAGLADLSAASPRLTPAGREIATGLAALAAADPDFSPHERTALQHLLARLARVVP